MAEFALKYKQLSANLMKVKMKCILAVLMMFPLLSTLFSCSSDDEPGQELVGHLKSFILLDDDEVAFEAMPDRADAYLLAVTDRAEAIQMCSKIFKMHKWDGSSTTVNIPEAGTVKIEKDPMDGVFYVVRFNVAGLPGMTLYITTEEYYNNQNIPISFPKECRKCRSRINPGLKKCPNCGSTDIGNVEWA